MTVISKERIERVSQLTQFFPETIEKVLHLLEFLDTFTASPLVNEFALIGGTAIFLSREDIPRLSEDIDLDYIGEPALGMRTDKLNSVKQRHVNEIDDLAKKLKWETKLDQEQSGERDTTLYLTAPGGVRVELNLSYRSCYYIFEPVDLQMGPLEHDPFKTKVKIKGLCKEELWASKLVACIQDKPSKELKDFHRDPKPRVKARHIYDIYWLKEHLPSKLDLDTLRKCFILIGVSRIKHFLWYRGEIIQYANPEHISQHVFPMLRMSERVPQAEHAAWQVRLFLDQVIYARICPEEYEFMEAWEHGAFIPATLFPHDKYPGIADRLRKIRFYDDILGILVGGGK